MAVNDRLTFRDLPPAAARGSLTVIGDSRVHRTAHAELAALLARHAPNLNVVAGLSPELPASADAYELRPLGDTLHLLGSTPRGLLQAVYTLEELLLAGPADDHGVLRRGEFQFRERIFHARFQPWPGTRADVRFLAHLGATHCLVCHDWQGTRRSLQGYVTSPVFPDAVDSAEVTTNHSGLRRLLDNCVDHGLCAMLWLTELPCQGGPWVPPAEREKFLTRFPADVLSDSGTYEGKVLCFSHPRVQEFYRDLLARFFADFPEIETLFLFGLDSGGEFCDSDCPRCRGLSKFAQRDRLVCFLIEEGQKVRSGLRVLTTGWGWDAEPEEFLRRQSALPAFSGLYLAAQKDGWQCERQSHDFLRAARRACRERGQTFIGYDNFHWGDDSVHSLGDIQDFPLGIAAKLRRWHALGADGVFDHWGNSPEDIWCNSVACREFFLNPHADASAVCAALARRQFGPAAGPLALAAWEALERAHATLSTACTWSPGQWPMWYSGRKIPPLPAHFSPDELLRTQPPPRREGDVLYNPPALADALAAVAAAWRDAAPHLADAERLLTEAAALAADTAPVFYQFWHPGAAPTPRAHLLRQRLYVAATTHAGREIGGHFGLHALWEQCARNPAAYRTRATTALRAQISLCREAADFFSAQGHPKDWPAHYAAKATAIESWLADA